MGLGAAGLVLALGAALWLSIAEPWHPSARLPGGTMSAVRVTYGRQHSPPPADAWWESLLVRWRLLPPLVTIPPASTDHETLVAWTRYTGAAAATYVPMAEDEHGCVFPARSLGAWEDSAWWKGQVRRGHAWEFPAYPRRSSVLTLRWVDTEAARVVATMRIPNPHVETTPGWSGPTGPPPHRTGALEFRWTLARQDRPDGVPTWSAAPTARYRGRPEPPWIPLSLAVRDASGNVLEDSAPLEPGQPYRFPGLCTREAWKIRAELAPAGRSGVPPVHTWTARGVPVQEGGEVETGHESAWAGNRLRVALTMGTSDIVTGIAVPRGAPSRLQPVLIAARDERGRPIPVFLGASYFYPASVGHLGNRHPDLDWRASLHRLAPPRGTRKVDLTFAVYETRTAEFLFQPEAGPAGAR